MAKLTNRLHVKQNDTVQEVICYTTQEEATPTGGSCMELKNNNTTCYIPLWDKSISDGKYHTPLSVTKNNTEYWVDTLSPQSVNLNYYARDNVANYETVTTLPQSNIDELTGIIAGSDASYAFVDCTNLTSLSGVETTWDMSNVLLMDSMFNGCSSLTSLDTSNWVINNTGYPSNAYYTPESHKGMTRAFFGCGLQYLSLADLKFQTLSLNYTFSECSNLQCLDLSNAITSILSSSGVALLNTLKDSPNLEIIDLTNFPFDRIFVTDLNSRSFFGFCNHSDTINVSYNSKSIQTNVYYLTCNYVIINNSSVAYAGYVEQIKSSGSYSMTQIISASILGIFTVISGVKGFASSTHEYIDTYVYSNLKILVPRNLVNSYKSHDLWGHIADHFYAIEDYTITKNRATGQITVTPK